MAAQVLKGISGWENGFNNGVEVRTFAEQRTLEIEATGNLATLLKNQPTQGKFYGVDTDFYGHSPEVGKGWGVKTSTVTSDGAGVGTLRLSLVQIASADTAYDISYEIDLSEVQMSLKKHPSLDAAAISIIQQWEATPEAVRVYGSGSSIGFRYYAMDATTAKQGALTAVDTKSKAYDYLYALASGIETYNVYLPVITKTSHYLTLSTTKIDVSKLGTFDSPPITVGSYSSDSKYWFKSADKYARANDGTATRTEQWTYTNDTTHSWIYEKS